MDDHRQLLESPSLFFSKILLADLGLYRMGRVYADGMPQFTSMRQIAAASFLLGKLGKTYKYPFGDASTIPGIAPIVLNQAGQSLIAAIQFASSYLDASIVTRLWPFHATAAS